MPKINSEEVEYLAQAMLINLTEEEKARFTSELDVLIKDVSSVTEAVTEDIPATSHPQTASNVWREDIPGETLSRDVALAAAPESENGLFAVPQILGEEA